MLVFGGVIPKSLKFSHWPNLVGLLMLIVTPHLHQSQRVAGVARIQLQALEEHDPA